MATQPSSSKFRSLLFLTLLLAAGAAGAQVKRTQVYKADVAEPGREAVVVKSELDPNTHAGRHYHPGDEISYVTEGEAELLVDGEAPRRLKAGDAFVVKTGKVHDLRDVGSTPLRLLSVYVVEKGKPLATPVK
ncbi:cupin domain-containing protein [Massilia horti]|uniref:Cupin domain-containing protein n=1 Tax=Massilia horti TaxID=2562153 RepID=A0A4Y9T522_9BURK|nr:cupin domain-containing protein [Massilia horti]TFW33011.1 cupin domain-containing protein [Massilia horti]